jgi:2-amino-4-hydroxy-6-hydroxymethyldihydropteridine diphosphokinase
MRTFATPMKTVYLSLGSNMGDRARNIARAIEALGAHGVRVTRQSSLYETEPVDVRGGGWFLNCVVEAETDLMPRQLMQALLAIERSLGRRRRPTSEEPCQGLKEPRTIDMDILLFGSSAVQMPELEIPHPRMTERRFVLVPLAEIAPEVRHPILKQTIAELLAATPDRSQVQKVPSC